MTPTVFTWELLVGQVSHMRISTEVIGLSNIMNNSFQTSLKLNFHLHEKSFVYKMLYLISPTYVCFTDLTAYFKLNVVDFAAGKVDTKLSILKDDVEIGKVTCLVYGLEMVMKATSIYTDNKIVGKMTPTFFTWELLVGQVSHMKITSEVSNIMNKSSETSVRLNLHLHENSYLYKMLYLISPSYVCLKDLTAHLKLNVVDLAAGKMDTKFSILKDNVEIGQVDCVISGTEMVMKASSIYTEHKIVVKMTPTVFTWELLVGQVSHMKITTEVIGLSNIMNRSFQTSVRLNVHLHEKSYLYNMLYLISPTYACFNDLTAFYKWNVVDLAARKVDGKLSVLKDNIEIGQVACVISGTEMVIKATSIYTDHKIVAKMTPTDFTWELLVGQVPHMKVSIEMIGLSKIMNRSSQTSVKINLHLHEKSYLYKMLYLVSPSYVCFTDLTAYYKLDVIDLAAGNIETKLSILKDDVEIGQVTCAVTRYEMVVKASSIYTDMKIVAKMTPTVFTLELLVGQVSHMKITTEVLRLTHILDNSFQSSVKMNLQLHENSYVYKMLYLISPSYVSFSDLTVHYQLKSTDLAAWKVNAKFSLLKDNQEISYVKSVVSGPEMVITSYCIYTDMSIVAKITPTVFTLEHFVGQVSHMKITTEVIGLSNIMKNSFQTSLKMNLQLQEESYLYKILYLISPSSICFKDLTAFYKLNVIDLASGKVESKVSVLKNSIEISHMALVLNNGCQLRISCPFLTKNILIIQDVDHIEMNMDYAVSGIEKIITTTCNLIKDIKIVTRLSPTMITNELLVGEQSQLKHIIEIRGIEDIKQNSFKSSVKMTLHLQENSYLYKMLYFISPNYMCYKDLTVLYQFNVVDRKAGKIDAKFSLLKDSFEIGQIAFTSNGLYKLEIFCPYLIKDVLKIQSIDNFEIKLNSVVSGNERSIIATCNIIKDIKIVTKMSPTMLTYELIIGDVSHMKHSTEVIGLSDVKSNSFETSLKFNLHLHENSFLYKVLYFISPSYLSFQDLTASYQVNVVDKATGQVDTKVSFLKDSVEIGQVSVTSNGAVELQIFCPYLIKNVLRIKSIDHLEINLDYVKSGNEKVLIASCNIIKDIKIAAKMTPTMLTSELLVGQVSHMKLTTEMMSFSNVKTNSFHKSGKMSLLLHEDSYLYKLLSILSPSLDCFKDLTVNYQLKSGAKTGGKVEAKVSFVKDLVEIGQWTVSSIGEEKYEIKLNEISLVQFVPFVQLVIENNQISIVPQHKMFSALTTVITWKSFSIFENTVGIQVLYKKVAHKVLLTWNMNKLPKAFVEAKLLGSGCTLLGDYELLHHLNWNMVNLLNMDLMWNGKVVSTGIPVLTKPVLGEGKVTFNNYGMDMAVVGKHGTETYQLIFKTNPLKIALLPFFQWP